MHRAPPNPFARTRTAEQNAQRSSPSSTFDFQKERVHSERYLLRTSCPAAFAVMPVWLSVANSRLNIDAPHFSETL